MEGLNIPKLGWKLRLIILILVAFIIRMILLGKPMITWDEHVYFEEGMKRLETFNPKAKVWSGEIPRNVDNPPLGFYYLGFFGKIGKVMGFSGYSSLLGFARMGGVVLGMITIILVFLIGREVFGTEKALLSSAIFAFLPLSVGWSRMAYIEILALFSYTLAVFTFFKTRGWGTGNRASWRKWNYS